MKTSKVVEQWVSAIKLPYGAKMTEKELNDFIEICPSARFKIFDDFKIPSWASEYDKEDKQKNIDHQTKRWEEYIKEERKEVVIDNEAELNWVRLNDIYESCPWLKYEVVKTKKIKIPVEVDANLSEIITLLEEFKTAALNFNISANKEVNSFNEVCNVHIGGSLLMNVNELLLQEDSCTDDIQGHLEKGWRIVAVCVQPDGRRPDYILGRFNPKKEGIGEGASRG